MAKKPRQYSPELRAEVVKYVLDDEHTCAQAARAFNLVAETIRNWVNAEKEKRKGNTPEVRDAVDRAQLAELERKVKELEAENSFLKKAALDSKSQGNTLGRGSVAEALAGAVVQSGGQGVEVGLAVQAQIGAFR